jgi:hypothetical protein
MILMRENPLHWPLEVVGTENRDFFGPRNGYKRSKLPIAEYIICPQPSVTAQSSNQAWRAGPVL